MSRAEWLGYTPMTADAEAWMTKLWRQHNLPEEPDFSYWSLEYARDIYEIVRAFTNPDVVSDFEKAGIDPRNRLLKALLAADVWDDDRTKQQWVPLGWTPPDET